MIFFHWSLSDSKCPQVSRTLLSILPVLNNSVVWIVSTLQFFSGPLRPGGAFPTTPCLRRFWTPTVWLPVLTELYNSSRSLDRPLNLWNGIFDRHQAEITVMQFRGHSLPVHQSMSVSWNFYLVPFCHPNLPTRFLSITGHWDVSFPSGASLWNGMFGRVEGQNTTHLPGIFLFGSLPLLSFRGCPRGVMVKAMDCRIVVSEFVLQSRHHVHFRGNTLRKGMNPLILPAMG